MREIGPPMQREPGESGPLPARREQELPAGRSVESGELHIRQREIRREPEDEARRPCVRQDCRGSRARAQSGPAGKGWAVGPPPCAACSFIFLTLAATVQALALKPAFLTWPSLRFLIASSGIEHQSLFFSI